MIEPCIAITIFQVSYLLWPMHYVVQLLFASMVFPWAWNLLPPRKQRHLAEWPISVI